ncbi:3',5'-cyclic-AMP phosphodiesterase [Orbus sturtevantii]|uniref:3',5'-cyclic-AMP phosphodiesterase n=1 Tax=Orbus sturtevantii TaxID=3074109 RepID=UPI00370D3F2D
MKKYLSLPIKNNNKAKILHITDTHLFANESDSLLGIKTNASFNAVIDEIKQQPCDFDLIVATGDFVQDGSKSAYLRFANAINQFPMPCVWLAGNHDVYTNMKLVFEQQKLPEKKTVLLGDNWLVILLNSQVQGEAFGMLSDAELAFLSLTIEQYPDKFIMIFLHHHPVMSNCQWLDQHCLKNSQQFGLLVKQYQHIKSIAWGHIHQRSERIWHHCKVFSTPSTCVQFKPASDEFSLAYDAPGWRVIELNTSGEVDSRVYSLNENLFMPDTSQNGY